MNRQNAQLFIPPPGSPGRWGFGPFSKASPASNRGERDSSRAARSVLSGGMTPRPRQQRAAPASSDPRGRAKRTTERVRGPHFCGARRSGRVTSLSNWQLEGSSPSRRVAGRSSDQPALIRLACGVQIPGPLFGQGGGGVEGTRTQTMGCCGNNQYRAEPVSSPARHFFLRRCGNGASALASNSDAQRESFQDLARGHRSCIGFDPEPSLLTPPPRCRPALHRPKYTRPRAWKQRGHSACVARGRVFLGLSSPPPRCAPVNSWRAAFQ